MSFKNLRAFVDDLSAQGELVRVEHPASVDREITEIADRCMKSADGGPALLFENVRLLDGSASEFPVAINLFGSHRRIARALGVEDLDEIGNRIEELLRMQVPETFSEKIAMLPKLAELARYPPKSIRGAPPCQKVIQRGDEADITRIPHLKCWPEDGGAYITFPLVITRHPRTGILNAGLYRIQILDGRRMAMHWQRHKVGAAHWRDMAVRGERMPVVVAIGCDPATMYAGSAPLPPQVDEFVFSGFLRSEPVRLGRAVSCELPVPAEAEVVIEGYIDPAEELVLEGPFGDHTGFYSLADYYPCVHVEAVTYREGAIYPATIVGRPPMEDFYLGHATERIFLPLLRMTMPEVVDYHMPAEGIFHNLVFVSIDKQYPG